MSELRALVTGASSGVGIATARMIHASGGAVALVARRADVLAELAAGLGDRAFAFPCDVSDPGAVAGFVAQAFDTMGGLDLVVNAAGIDGPATLEEVTPEKWATTIGVNLTGTFWVAREAALRMSSGGSYRQPRFRARPHRHGEVRGLLRVEVRRDRRDEGDGR